MLNRRARELIVTADDGGYDLETNEAVERCVRDGIVTQLSVLANGPALEDAARRFRGATVGIHLNLTEGRALRGPVRGATDDAGTFLGPSLVLLHALLGRLDLDAATRELEAQIACVRAAGLSPSYADGHQHVHVFPGLLPRILDVGRSNALTAIRVPAESPFSPHSGARWKRAMLSSLSLGARERATAGGLRTPQHFRGLSLFRRTSDHHARLLALLASLPEGRTELMVHPRGGDRGAVEVASLTHPDTRATLDRANIRLITARDL